MKDRNLLNFVLLMFQKEKKKTKTKPKPADLNTQRIKTLLIVVNLPLCFRTATFLPFGFEIFFKTNSK